MSKDNSRPLKTEFHHWWPRSLLKFWAAQDGRITALPAQHDKEPIRAPYNGKAFWGISNAHHIKFSDANSPWDSTFEHLFQRADDQFGSLVEWLTQLELITGSSTQAYEDRFKGVPIEPQQRLMLAECLASLIARSPSTRNKIRLTIEGYRTRGGIEKRPEEVLIAANLVHLYKSYVRGLEKGGKLLVIVSNNREFAFGDGFLHNFPLQSGNIGNVLCVIPLTPQITVLFVRPFQYRTLPELMTISASSEEVDFLNGLIQIYSRHFIFYREIEPRLMEAFSLGEFQELRWQNEPWLRNFIDSVANVRPTSG